MEPSTKEIYEKEKEQLFLQFWIGWTVLLTLFFLTIIDSNVSDIVVVRRIIAPITILNISLLALGTLSEEGLSWIKKREGVFFILLCILPFLFFPLVVLSRGFKHKKIM